jgi:hypothetical protein
MTDSMPEVTEETPAEEVSFAFTIVVPLSGVPYVVLGSVDELKVAREAQIADVRQICQEIVHDLNAQATAQYVMRALKSVADAKTERPPAERVQSALKKRNRR